MAIKLELMLSMATFKRKFSPGFGMVVKSNETHKKNGKIKWQKSKEPDNLHMTLIVFDRFDCIENINLIHSEDCRFELNELMREC